MQINGRDTAKCIAGNEYYVLVVQVDTYGTCTVRISVQYKYKEMSSRVVVQYEYSYFVKVPERMYA